MVPAIFCAQCPRITVDTRYACNWSRSCHVVVIAAGLYSCSTKCTAEISTLGYLWIIMQIIFNMFLLYLFIFECTLVVVHIIECDSAVLLIGRESNDE